MKAKFWKKCSMCKKILSIKMFHKHIRMADGHNYACKFCVKHRRNNTPIEHRKKIHNIATRKNRLNLSDAYVRECATKYFNSSAKDIHPDIINMYRDKIRLRRLIYPKTIGYTIKTKETG